MPSPIYPTFQKNKPFADSFEGTATKISTVLFIISILGALASEWDTFINNFLQLGPAIILLIVMMLLIAYTSSNWFYLEKPNSIFS